MDNNIKKIEYRVVLQRWKGMGYVPIKYVYIPSKYAMTDVDKNQLAAAQMHIDRTGRKTLRDDDVKYYESIGIKCVKVV